MSQFKARPAQKEVLKFEGGKMGISAVPGSGKTQTLSALAARLIIGGRVDDDQEILVVTLTNSAVNNFSSRISGMLKAAGLLPEMGYRVRTLHGLSHDIVRERPNLAGLPENFQIVDERDAAEILRGAVEKWLHNHPEFFERFENPNANSNLRRREWVDLMCSTGNAFIGIAKDNRQIPAHIRRSIEALESIPLLLQFGLEVYTDYQRALMFRGAVDFDDLIRLAFQNLELDPEYLYRLRRRWPVILEDEAQDSSRLQEDILRKLSGEDGGWVRVGDPNQAIFETFTTADPKYLVNFLKETGVQSKTLPNSGRSTRSIIHLANSLIRWTNREHPNEWIRDALTEPEILPTDPGDPQPNPPDQPDKITLYLKRMEPDEELKLVARSARDWLDHNPEKTLAILVPRNERGAKMVEVLKEYKVQTVELLQSSQSTRLTTGLLESILSSLADPGSPQRLAAAFRELHRDERGSDAPRPGTTEAFSLLRSLKQVEDFLHPSPGESWLDKLSAGGVNPDTLRELDNFRSLMIRWQNATLLPVDQLTLTISQEIFTQPADLALAHKIALFLEHAASSHPEWVLPDFCAELHEISTNNRKFLGFSEEDSGFDPDEYPGKAVVATIHKAKGLEWDRVYLLSVSNYDFPSDEPGDSFISEKYFVRGALNLPEEIVSSLQALLEGNIPGVFEESSATLLARQKYARERLRLLFVGITRARSELVITWNTGKRGNQRPATPFQALSDIWEAGK